MQGIVSLCFSIVFIIHFRALRCTRIRIHMHLFASLALGCVSWLAWYKVVIEQPTAMADYPVDCCLLCLR